MELKLTNDEVNFQYLLDVDYESDFPGNSCECDGPCRCKTIEDVEIEDFDNSTINCIFDKYIKNIKIKNSQTGRWNQYFSNQASKLSNAGKIQRDLEFYCIDRLCVHYGVYNNGNYEVSVSNGYYGEEIDSITFNYEAALMKDIIKVLKMKKDIDKVKFVIEKEYKFLLDRIKNCSGCRITTFDLVHLTRNSVEYDRIKHNDDVYPYELTYNIPIGIVHDDRILDGHNRTKGALINNYKVKDYIEIF